MALDTKISRQLDNGCVQVDVKYKDAPPKYYKVPQEKADSFSQKLKKQDKNSKIINNTAFGISLLGGVLAGNVLSKNIESGVLKFIIGSASGVAAATAALFACSKYSEHEHNTILKEYGAKQIFYKA